MKKIYKEIYPYGSVIRYPIFKTPNKYIENKEFYLEKFKHISPNEQKRILKVANDIFPDEYLYKIVLESKSIKRIKICLEYISPEFIIKKIRNPYTCKSEISRLTLSPYSAEINEIIKREDTNGKTLLQILKNHRKDKTYSLRQQIINDDRIKEEDLLDIVDSDNVETMQIILLSNKVTKKLIKKVQKSQDQETKEMSLVMDEDTDIGYIEKIMRREFKKLEKVNYDTSTKRAKSAYMPTDILLSILRNPKLPSNLIDKFKGFNMQTVINCILNHPNVSKETIEFYKRNGIDGVEIFAEKKANERE